MPEVTPSRHPSLLFSLTNHLDRRDQTLPHTLWSITYSPAANPDPKHPQSHYIVKQESHPPLHYHSRTGKMVEKKVTGFNGLVSFDDTTPPPPTRPSLLPSRDQVASLAGLPLPQPRAVKQPPQPDLTAAAQEEGSNVDAAELNDFEMVDAPSPLESAPVGPDNERKSFDPEQVY